MKLELSLTYMFGRQCLTGVQGFCSDDCGKQNTIFVVAESLRQLPGLTRQLDHVAVHAACFSQTQVKFDL